MPNTLFIALALAAAAGFFALAHHEAARAELAPNLEPPATLAETGLYAADGSIAPGVLPFTPQYALWSDGASKRRWIYLPGAIDASNADEWTFPVGTKLWKEFSFGRRVETRYLVRAADGWKMATYAWSGDTAVRSDGATVAIDGGTHQIPTASDCRSCHNNAASPVLGFSALQLSVDRDPGALHVDRAPGSIDLAWLVAARRIDVADIAPRIAGNPTQRSALGYLHGNCGGCHRADGPLRDLGLVLAHSTSGDEPGVLTTVGQPAQFRAPAQRIAPGDPAASLLLTRISARHSAAQMPPIGTQRVDQQALRLVADWIDQLAPHQQGERR